MPRSEYGALKDLPFTDADTDEIEKHAEALQNLKVEIRMLFIFGFGSTASLKFWPLVLDEMGFTTIEIGYLTFGVLVGALGGSVLWGSLADRFGHVRLLMGMANVGLCVSVLMMILPVVQESTGWFMFFLLTYSLFGVGVIVLTDVAALALPAGDRTYGQLRLYGAFGYLFVATAMGITCDILGLIRGVCTVLTFCGILIFLVLLRGWCKYEELPPSKRHALGGTKTNTNSPWAVLCAPKAWLLWTNLFIMGMTTGFVETYEFLYIEEYPAFPGTWYLSLLIAITTLSNIPVFYYSAELLQKFTPMQVLLLAQWVYIARVLCYNAIPQEPSWCVYLFTLLEPSQGVNYALMWVASVQIGYDMVELGQQGITQALIHSSYAFLGAGSGAVVGGYIVDGVGFNGMFFAGAGIMLTWSMTWLGLLNYFDIEMEWAPTPGLDDDKKSESINALLKVTSNVDPFMPSPGIQSSSQPFFQGNTLVDDTDDFVL